MALREGRFFIAKTHLGKDDAAASLTHEGLLLLLLRAREATRRRMVTCGYCKRGK